MTALVWYRRDLRVRDHPALRAAADRHDRIVPVFCLDDRLLAGRHASGPRTAFLLESLADLDRSLRGLGSGLVIRRGRPERELVELARQVGADEMHSSADVSPFARARRRRTGKRLREAGVASVGHPGLKVRHRYGPYLRQRFGHVLWGGTEVATYWNGSRDGAVRSGEVAAREVLKALRR